MGSFKVRKRGMQYKYGQEMPRNQGSLIKITNHN